MTFVAAKESTNIQIIKLDSQSKNILVWRQAASNPLLQLYVKSLLVSYSLSSAGIWYCIVTVGAPVSEALHGQVSPVSVGLVQPNPPCSTAPCSVSMLSL